MGSLELAQEALQAFSQWAEKEERETGDAAVPVLRLYSDWSGCVEDAITGTIYLYFSDLKSLLEKVKIRM